MSIPKPLVQLNQAFIVISVLAALFSYKTILVIPFAVGVYTLFTKHNPVIKAGKWFLRKPAHHYVPEDKDQQLFNQWIATISLGLALICFYAGQPLLGYAFALMVTGAAGAALLGFCIGCTIRYRFMMWKYKRSRTSSE
ncbi:DUF4395 domain-containing protein [Halobacillus salinarum]|uniref:DUF4395 domain-containing protein n=1 Tax=Halobacillus salinarum TaxID=2932257 RepID=A0ABY4EIE7_9BACI|nr:DUF4395 domain-containing protein [Halobacillus salinarum]UOQ43909.1 DUF4395 domain-containing protein [Halobacillus salinarum]